MHSELRHVGTVEPLDSNCIHGSPNSVRTIVSVSSHGIRRIMIAHRSCHTVSRSKVGEPFALVMSVGPTMRPCCRLRMAPRPR